MGFRLGLIRVDFGISFLSKCHISAQRLEGDKGGTETLHYKGRLGSRCRALFLRDSQQHSVSVAPKIHLTVWFDLNQ